MRWVRAGVIDGDLWWASTNVTTEEGSDVIGKYFTANHYDYTYVYSWTYITENGKNLNGIICPDGWRLPTMNEFSALCKASGFTGENQTNITAGYTTVNSKNGRWFGPGVASGRSPSTSTHIFIPLAGSGGFTNNTPGYYAVGALAHLWSSTPSGSSTAYNLRLGSSYINPQDGGNRSYAFTVRCVADLQ